MVSSELVSHISERVCLIVSSSTYEVWRLTYLRTTFWFLSGNNIHLYGGGTIDGNGQVWWDTFNNSHASLFSSPTRSTRADFSSQNAGTAGGSSTTFARPIPLTVGNASNVVVENIRQIGSPFWVGGTLFSPDPLSKLILRIMWVYAIPLREPYSCQAGAVRLPKYECDLQADQVRGMRMTTHLNVLIAFGL